MSDLSGESICLEVFPPTLFIIPFCLCFLLPFSKKVKSGKSASSEKGEGASEVRETEEEGGVAVVLREATTTEGGLLQGWLQKPNCVEGVRCQITKVLPFASHAQQHQLNNRRARERDLLVSVLSQCLPSSTQQTFENWNHKIILHGPFFKRASIF